MLADVECKHKKINWEDLISHAHIAPDRKGDIIDRELQRIKNTVASKIWGNKDWRNIYYSQHYKTPVKNKNSR